MGRSLAQLRAQADEYEVDWDDNYTASEIMDALRDKLGVADPDFNIEPMKAKDLKSKIDWASERPFAGLSTYFTPDYVVEPKLDGVRVRVIFGTTGNSIPTGRRSDVMYGFHDRGPNFPHMSELLIPDLAGTIIDCEVMMPEGTSIETRPGQFTVGSLNTIMSVLTQANHSVAHERQEKYGWAEFHAFDILALAGEDLMHLGLDQRRIILDTVLDTIEAEAVAEGRTSPFRLLPQYEVDEKRLEWLISEGHEGGMIKRRSSVYEPGGRTDSWLKVKKMSTGDFFIIGSNPGKGRNLGKVGSLKIAYLDETGIAINCGEVRGFSDAVCDEVTDVVTGSVKPRYMRKVIEVMGQGRTKNEKIRHPNFVRFRPDKTAEDCDRSQLELFSVV